MDFNHVKAIVEFAKTSGEMSIVIGNCSIKYHGRAASKLSNGDRMLIIKSDGSFLVHQSRKMQAINYQSPGAIISTEIIKDTSDNREKLLIKAEKREPKELIEVKFLEVNFAGKFKLKDDEKLEVFGSEKQLSDLLMQDLHLIEEGLVPLKQESPLHKGTIDILAQDKNGKLVVIEVKRRDAHLNAVSQLERYRNDVEKRKNSKTRGILCAPGISETAMKLLSEKGLEFYKLKYEISNPSAKIIGLEKKQKILEEFL